MIKEMEITIEDCSTIAEYMRGDDRNRPVVVDVRHIKGAYMTSSKLISLQAIAKARQESYKLYR
ncbi:hypothetical protein M0383_002798 [Escherichia coli]|uniref:hypothetical protein n=1 Tax=Escherichia coli TaxID=562 RepID=UPI000BDF0637|nr:hypothetical protein [Escherichia coli]EEQ6082445.1 hypothetical protein [Escherichia coli]EEW1027306.1 hypothetical protein [Escherichia coli]EEW1973696.1 hypothetical protein [Escherichia coli]EEY8042595.1 hypothetical protein [Escherichia coli]EEZ0866102.1 hypothetical protein [Escherichia coli]